MMRSTPWFLLAAVSAAPLLGACSDSTGPGSGPVGVALSVSQFDSTLGTGPARLEVKLVPGTLEAREVHVEADDMEEKIVSTVTAIDPAAGTVTLALGGLVVSYGDATRFRTRSESHATRAAWEAAISAAIGNGGQPPIEARRNAPGQPQAPDDAGFTAQDLRLADRTEAPKLEIYVDSDNFAVSGAAPQVGTLTVLGLPIAITTSTSLHDDQTVGGGPAEGEFEGAVSAVDVGAGTLTLADGRIINISGVSFDPTGDLYSVQAVATAVSGGSPVRAEGRGTVASAGPPLTIDATALKVEVDD